MAIRQERSVDGSMTVEEFKKWLKKFDADGDGRISRGELRVAMRSLGVWFTTWKSGRGLKQADANHNGYIEDNEISNLVEFAQKNFGIKISTY